MKFQKFMRIAIALFLVAGCSSTQKGQNLGAPRGLASNEINFQTEDFGKTAIHSIVYSRSTRQLLALVSDAHKVAFIVRCSTPLISEDAQLTLGMVSNCTASTSSRFVMTDEVVAKMNKGFPNALAVAHEANQIEADARGAAAYKDPPTFMPFFLGMGMTIWGGVLMQEHLRNYGPTSGVPTRYKIANAVGTLGIIGIGVTLLAVYVNNNFIAGYKHLPIQPLGENLKTRMQQLLTERGLSEKQKAELNEYVSKSNDLEPILFETFARALHISILRATSA